MHAASLSIPASPLDSRLAHSLFSIVISLALVPQATMRNGLGQKPRRLSGGSGLFSTAQDYSKFVRFLLDGNERIAKRATIDEMVRSNQVHTQSQSTHAHSLDGSRFVPTQAPQ